MIRIPKGLSDQVKYMVRNNKEEPYELIDRIDEHIEASVDDFTRGYYSRLREELGSSLGDNAIIEEVVEWLEARE